MLLFGKMGGEVLIFPHYFYNKVNFVLKKILIPHPSILSL